ncbi:acyl-CoA dehydrogenase family protein [Cupriavidus basilensis]
MADVIRGRLGKRTRPAPDGRRAGGTRRHRDREDDWDGIGQRQDRQRHRHLQRRAGARRRTPGPARRSADALCLAGHTAAAKRAAQCVRWHGAGALDEGRPYTATRSRPWIHSGVARHVDDPWVQRKSGELAIRTLAATELADQAARSLDAIYRHGPALTPELRGRAAIDLATANLYAGETGLAVSSEIFEVMGARSATNANGFDRFWRNVRTHTLHNPAGIQETYGGHMAAHGRIPSPAVYR